MGGRWMKRKRKREMNVKIHVDGGRKGEEKEMYE